MKVSCHLQAAKSRVRQSTFPADARFFFLQNGLNRYRYWVPPTEQAPYLRGDERVNGKISGLFLHLKKSLVGEWADMLS